MMKCKCKDWEENSKILDSALMLYSIHGLSEGLKKTFVYCPYCGHNLEEEKSK